MGIGFSLFLIALGAILAWAVNYQLSGIDIQVVGAILIFIGCAGLALSLLFWTSFAPFADRAPFARRSVTVVAPQPDRIVVREPTTTVVHTETRSDHIEPR